MRPERTIRNVVYTERNQLTLLHCGDEFFPALIGAIDSATTEIYLETYLFSHDITGALVHDALCRAAQRNVQVHVIVDWLGTGHKRSMELERIFFAAGVHFRSFNPWFKRGFSRTHRKLFVADRKFAIIGGININHDLYAEGQNKNDLSHPRWDFSVSVTGPLVAEICLLISDQWQKLGRFDWRTRFHLFAKKRSTARYPKEPVVAALATRDNYRNRRTIEKAYIQALSGAKSHVLIATPYFAPGRRFRNAIINAAKRGVDVTLLIGNGDVRLQDIVTSAYYPKLLRFGVNIVEYSKTHLHAKVAVVDDEWATVGSCNCDGLSLFVNHEANLLIKDAPFAKQLSTAIWQGIADGQRIDPTDYQNISWQRKLWYGCAIFVYSMLIRLIAVEDFM